MVQLQPTLANSSRWISKGYMFWMVTPGQLWLISPAQIWAQMKKNYTTTRVLRFTIRRVLLLNRNSLVWFSTSPSCTSPWCFVFSTFCLVAKCCVKFSPVYSFRSDFWVVSGCSMRRMEGCGFSQTLQSSIFQKTAQVWLSQPLKQETKPQRQGLITATRTISMTASRMTQRAEKILPLAQMVAMTSPAIRKVSTICRLPYLKVLKQPAQLNQLMNSPSLLPLLPSLGGCDFSSATEYPRKVIPIPKASAQLQKLKLPVVQNISKKKLMEQRGRKKRMRARESSPSTLKLNWQSQNPFFYCSRLFRFQRVSGLARKSQMMQASMSSSPASRNSPSMRAAQLRLLDRFRYMQMPFMQLGELSSSRQLQTSRKLRMPARKRRGSNPLKAGLIESRKAREKQLSCSTVIISTTMILAVRKARQVMSARKARAMRMQENTTEAEQRPYSWGVQRLAFWLLLAVTVVKVWMRGAMKQALLGGEKAGSRLWEQGVSENCRLLFWRELLTQLRITQKRLLLGTYSTVQDQTKDWERFKLRLVVLSYWSIATALLKSTEDHCPSCCSNWNWNFRELLPSNLRVHTRLKVSGEEQKQEEQALVKLTCWRGQLNPLSTLQAELQPSPETWLPSSHSQLQSKTMLPQQLRQELLPARLQPALQPRQRLVVLPTQVSQLSTRQVWTMQPQEEVLTLQPVVQALQLETETHLTQLAITEQLSHCWSVELAQLPLAHTHLPPETSKVVGQTEHPELLQLWQY